MAPPPGRVYIYAVATPFIAVVDDDESVRRALVRLLRSAGFDAVAFESARGLIERLGSQEFACAVVDLQMPQMSGLDLQRYLSMVQPERSLPIVVITAHDEPGTREACLAAGAAAYLRKPVEGRVLLEEIGKLTHAQTP